MHTQSRRQKITTPSNRPPSRPCLRFPHGGDSSRRGEPAIDPALHSVDPDRQRGRPTFATPYASSSSTDSYPYALSAVPMNEIPTSASADYSLNNAYNPDNRVNNGHIRIGNSSSRTSAVTTTYANDVTHVNIETVQFHLSRPRSERRRNRGRRRRDKKLGFEDRGRTWWRTLWCFY